jgi:hypothetical protein
MSPYNVIAICLYFQTPLYSIFFAAIKKCTLLELEMWLEGHMHAVLIGNKRKIWTPELVLLVLSPQRKSILSFTFSRRMDQNLF